MRPLTPETDPKTDHGFQLFIFNFKTKSFLICEKTIVSLSKFLIVELVIYLKNEKDFAVLEPLLKRMKIRFERKNGPKKAISNAKQPSTAQQNLESARAKLLQMLKEGVDVSSYGDPIQWQREVQQDNRLPFRD